MINGDCYGRIIMGDMFDIFGWCYSSWENVWIDDRKFYKGIWLYCSCRFEV